MSKAFIVLWMIFFHIVPSVIKFFDSSTSINFLLSLFKC